jgi:hypothetical protein
MATSTLDVLRSGHQHLAAHVAALLRHRRLVLHVDAGRLVSLHRSLCHHCSTSATCLSKTASSSATNCTEKDQSMLQRNQLQCIKRPVVTLGIQLSFEKNLIYAHLLIQSSDISLISKDYGHFLTKAASTGPVCKLTRIWSEHALVPRRSGHTEP